MIVPANINLYAVLIFSLYVLYFSLYLLVKITYPLCFIALIINKVEKVTIIKTTINRNKLIINAALKIELNININKYKKNQIILIAISNLDPINMLFCLFTKLIKTRHEIEKNIMKDEQRI